MVKECLEWKSIHTTEPSCSLFTVALHACPRNETFIIDMPMPQGDGWDNEKRIGRGALSKLQSSAQTP